MARALALVEHVIIEPGCCQRIQPRYTTNISSRHRKAKSRNVWRRGLLILTPAAKVVTRKQFLDEIDDDEFKRLALEPFWQDGSYAPEVVVVCGFTRRLPAASTRESFGTGSSVWPTLCAQVYREGRAAEISFAYPGLTPACHRCILSARYKAYLNDGFKNDVTSDGTPIFSTTRLNAIKGMIMMGILHRGTNNSRWGGLLQRIGNRNLVQIRLDPDVESTLGIQNFSEAFRGADPKQIFADEAIWRPQLQESPATGYAVACPDCGGTGDLRDAFGKFADTRIMPI